MAERRMFSKTIIDSDAFLDMPLSTQALYFHISMRADDDGFTNNPKKVMRMIGASQNELELLLQKRFLIAFESGVVVIKHWLIHNYIRSDRYKKTLHVEELSKLKVKDNKAYTEAIPTVATNGIPKDIPTDNQEGVQMDTQVRLGKVRLGKDSIGNIGEKPKKRFVPPEVFEVQQYCIERNNNIDAQAFVDFYSSKGWFVGKNKMKDWKAAVRTWERNRSQNSSNNNNTGPKEINTSAMQRFMNREG